MIVGIKELRARVPAKTRLMGLDHSKSRIGIALTDGDWRLATPLTVLQGASFTENMGLLDIILHEYGIKGLVLGLPLNMDGSEGPRAQSVRHFALNLDRAIKGLVISFVDERLSSFDADERLEGGSNKARDMQDAVAAAVILEDALKII